MLPGNMAAPIKGEWAVVVDKEYAQKARKLLESMGLWDESRKLQSTGQKVAIPVLPDANIAFGEFSAKDNGYIVAKGSNRNIICVEGIAMELISHRLAKSKKKYMKTPHAVMRQNIEELCQNKFISQESWLSYLQFEVPKNWEIHGDLVLLPPGCFKHTHWLCIGDILWTTVAQSVKCNRVARRSTVKDDGFRTPQVELLLGDNSFVTHIDNNIKYSYDIRKCMFSSGNITEKIRIGSLDCKEETVVDLYAGIGYYTLPYLVHASAQYVHACEWNPDAVEALKLNLKQNHVENRCTVHAGDNKMVCPVGIADRVNLGLIPSSEAAWPVACAALKPLSGGILHIHGNVSSFDYPRENSEIFNIVSDTPATFLCSGSELVHMGSCVDNMGHGQGPAKEIDPANNVQIESDSCADDVSSVTESAESNNSFKENPTCITEECSGCYRPVTKTVTQRDHDQTFHNVNEPCAMPFRWTHDGDNKCWWNCDKSRLKSAWIDWGDCVGNSIHSILMDLHKTKWTCTVLHVEHVKSYAPHIDHMVVDVLCKPPKSD